MQSAEISSRAFRFFEQRGHTAVPSASLIADDPTLLLINAGMAPFKPYFLGEAPPPWPRAASVQKCVRTVDIEEVGKTTRHGSFFQMFGNFSFGDYFKEKAIPWAWEFLTRPVADGGLGLPESKLWVTVYTDDDEAEHIWRTDVGVSPDRIQRLGMVDNYWSMGVPGPCGPCSEICIDRGPEFGPEGGPDTNGERYLEIWNLVFMQNIRGEGPAKEGYPIVGELPAKNIDTGLGLARVAAVLQGVKTIFEIDTTGRILDLAAELSGTKYGQNSKDDIPLRVVADHILASVMLIGDGVTPSNEGRGYILRRILRRAVRMMRLLGAQEPVVHELTTRTIDVMSPTYPELAKEQDRIHGTAVGEESAFLQTLKSGTAIFDLAAKEVRTSSSLILPGDKAFQLHDTYGFPIDLTLEMAEEQGLSVDEEGFRRLMAEQRARAKADAAARKTGGHGDKTVYRDLLQLGATEFTGYDQLESEATVRGLIREGERIPAASEGDIVEVVLDRTPLYAESGGQESDAGTIVADGLELEVLDVQKVARKLWVHQVRVRRGELTEGQEVLAKVDPEWRLGARQAHSGTHVVHAALRQVLGPNALQAGSYNKPGYLRLDFSWTGGLSLETRSEIEEVSNIAIRQDLPVRAVYTSLPEAREMGAIALFGETYDEEVRVIEIGGPWSRELCGGTHVERSSQINELILIGESSVGSGLRRIEGYVGLEAYRFLAKERALAMKISDLLQVPISEASERVSALLKQLRDAEKEVTQLRAAQLKRLAGEFVNDVMDVQGVSVVARHLSEPANNDELRKFVIDIRDRLGDRPAAVTVTTLSNDKPIVVSAVNDKGRERGLKAGDLVRVAAKVLKGGGGGKPDIAQGGGTDPLATVDALREVTRVIGEAVRP
ncbi:alanine--tRNA ligase [Kibdelosporangium philippinense]|uniref:Alanine--tRNA ligase n=1 Tax=Kibdelosporangium philippinense TaxID=211113 RepID=A0ABS8ZYJ8_9PSEU|nr:alanine--tRNA ligase [Kibdelosporangium philippinense]MCE7011778.1 alanine--tRNA ligase [Kibdelosporangium philippinense]